jgi:hypothetical protein
MCEAHVSAPASLDAWKNCRDSVGPATGHLKTADASPPGKSPTPTDIVVAILQLIE